MKSYLLITRKLLRLHVFFAMTAFSFGVSALSTSSDLPFGSSFMGLVDNQWGIYLSDVNGIKRLEIPGINNPRQITWSPEAGKVAIITTFGDVAEYEITKNKLTTLSKADSPHAYTQIRYINNGKDLIAIRLFQRKSKATRVVVFDRKKDDFVDLHHQRTPVFDPSVTGDQLFYTAVSCVESCGEIIQEVWVKSLTANTARQITLLNSIARNPVYKAQENSIYFSAYTEGHYHIWKYALQNSTLNKITSGDVTDIEPEVATDEDAIYFIRRTSGTGKIMKLKKDRLSLVLLEQVTDIRNLEINQ